MSSLSYDSLFIVTGRFRFGFQVLGLVAVCPMIGVGLGWEVWVCKEKVKEVLVLPSKMR